jgi:hypothetical protein
MRFPGMIPWKGAAPARTEDRSTRRSPRVSAAASVHEDLSEPDVADDGVDDERVFPQARHVVGVVGLVEGDGLVGPV